jgi:hypothetical protein
MTDDADAPKHVARRYLILFGVWVTSTGLLLALVSELVGAPSWTSFLATSLILYLAMRTFWLPNRRGDASSNPTTRVVVVTGALSLVAFGLSSLALGRNLFSLLIAGVAMLCVWMLGAWFIGR